MSQKNTKLIAVAVIGVTSVVLLAASLQDVDVDATQVSGTIAPAQRVVNTQISANDALNESPANTVDQDGTDKAEGTSMDDSVENSMESSMESAMMMQMSSSQSDDSGRGRHNGGDNGTDPIIF